MKTCFFLLLTLLAAGRAGAQSAPAAPADAAGQPAATDVIFRADGSETLGRVVAITPREVRYLPPASADTLRLAAADVFMVRFANGTREVLQSAVAPATTAAASDLLPGLSQTERKVLGCRDAQRGYRGSGPFLASLGAVVVTGPLLGLIAPAVIAPHAVTPKNLGAPRPELLADPTYGNAYREKVQRIKRGRAWGGYGLGTGVLVGLIWVSLKNMTIL